MQRPEGYAEARVQGQSEPIELGGHYCIIKAVKETTSKTNKPMVVVAIDFDGNDRQAGLFGKRFENDDRDGKKWPFAGTKYIMVNDYQDASKTSSAFKTFCSMVEKCNNFEIQWGVQNWGGQFVGKKIGAIYGNEESEYEGQRRKRAIIRWWCALDAVADAKIPEDKLLPNSQPGAAVVNGFVGGAALADEEVPFL